jgi:hypothetical protein
LACIGKADALWLLTQLAPMAFVDGAWLAGMARVDHQHSTLAPGLFEIYRDELGAGQVAQHHGNVMRRTLLAHGVTLPHCSEPAFRDWPGFSPAAFYLGCHWLAVAEHSAEFFSELLGVNLATELAGVGTDYFNAAALLRQNGIDPYFFELHNSIDNAAGGHTAWSVYAIDEYLRAINKQSGPSATNEAWRRIWAGYDSYALASKPLRTAIALHLGPRLVWRRLRGRSGKTQASRQPSSSAGGV